MIYYGGAMLWTNRAKRKTEATEESVNKTNINSNFGPLTLKQRETVCSLSSFSFFLFFLIVVVVVVLIIFSFPGTKRSEQRGFKNYVKLQIKWWIEECENGGGAERRKAQMYTHNLGLNELARKLLAFLLNVSLNPLYCCQFWIDTGHLPTRSFHHSLLVSCFFLFVM